MIARLRFVLFFRPSIRGEQKDMCLFVHATGTTGADAGARRAHVYERKCAQCGVVLQPTTRVAAHVDAYLCGAPCAQRRTLRTTCKACNHAQRTHRADRFWGVRWTLVRLPRRPVAAAPVT